MQLLKKKQKKWKKLTQFQLSVTPLSNFCKRERGEVLGANQVSCMLIGGERKAMALSLCCCSFTVRSQAKGMAETGPLLQIRGPSYTLPDRAPPLKISNKYFH